jgi:hypothetical protein
MLSFERRDPFPLLPLPLHSTGAIRTHSVAVDQWLGLRIDEIEMKLNRTGSRSPAPDASSARQNLWFGLDPQDLLTPYLEIRDVLERLELQAGEVVVDLGAAYGRMGFVMARCFPGSVFVGYEFVGERVVEGRERLKFFGAGNARLFHADLTSKEFQLPAAAHYFIYDFGTDSAIETVLARLYRASRRSSFKVVARGRRAQYAIDANHPWLKRSNSQSPTSYSIYESRVDAVASVEL